MSEHEASRTYASFDVSVLEAFSLSIAMISIEECKKYLGNTSLSDPDIEKIRGLLYSFVERVLDYYGESGMLVDKDGICQKESIKIEKNQI